MTSHLAWSSDDAFVLDGTTFVIEPFAPTASRVDRFVLAKPRWMLDAYLDLAPEVHGGRIVELGIARGGSIAFFAHLLQPAMLLALDIAPPIDALLEFVTDRGFADTVRPAFGVDQGDRERLEELARSTFGDDSLDLVIDDASHILGPSLASFATFFPRLRPGGILVLEDWSHAHTWERALRDHPDQRYGAELLAHTERPREDGDLSTLVLKLVLAAGYAPEVVADVDVRAGFTVVRRGEATLDPATFELDACFGAVGRSVLANGS